MTPDIVKELNRKGEQSEFHRTMLDHTRNLVKMSRSKMSEFYSDWDKQDQVYRGLRSPDKDDVTQARRDKPVKMIVPNTFAQVMTFSSFLFLLFNQNRTFFELVPTGDEDYGDKQKDSELIMERDLRHNQWNTVLFQSLLNVGRFGPGVLECNWTKELTHAFIKSEPQMINYNGVEVESRSGSEWQEFVKYEGNLIRPVSPYRWFPDTRFPLTEFQRGEFCASEEEYSISQLRRMEQSGEVAGLDEIKELPTNLSTFRGGESRFSFDIVTEAKKTAGSLYKPGQSEGTVIVTKCQIRLVPSEFKLTDTQKKLGPEEFPILYHLWYANDNRVIRCEPAYCWHDQFSWSLGQFTPDMHHTLSLGLADLIYRLQDVISWHINSRITDVRRNMRGRLIVDPQGVEPTSLDGDGDVYLRSGVSKSGVDRWIKQLDMRDTTQGHLTDADILGKIMQVVTGVNDNIMGQYNTGRRSAQEARTVLSGAAGRMKLHGHLLWDALFGPTGRMMLSNSRQELSFESFSRVIGGNPEELQARFTAFQGTPEEVITGDDYFTFDSTLSTEKGFMAQSLQDLLSVILQTDPSAAQRVSEEIDPAKIVDEIQYLRGAGNIKRFRYTKEQQLAIQQQNEAQRQTAVAMEQEKNKPSVALTGKLTPEHEAAAATLALGQPMRVGEPQGNGSEPRVRSKA